MRSLRPSVTPTDTTSHRSLPPSLLSQSRVSIQARLHLQILLGFLLSEGCERVDELRMF
jgi:hypothetical protein